jgi:hypothetical protein
VREVSSRQIAWLIVSGLIAWSWLNYFIGYFVGTHSCH